LRNSNLSARCGARRVRRSVYTSPAALNSRSLATDVGGALRYLLATFVTSGNRTWFSRHQSTAFMAGGTGSCARYHSTSVWTAEPDPWLLDDANRLLNAPRTDDDWSDDVASLGRFVGGEDAEDSSGSCRAASMSHCLAVANLSPVNRRPR